MPYIPRFYPGDLVVFTADGEYSLGLVVEEVTRKVPTLNLPRIELDKVVVTRLYCPDAEPVAIEHQRVIRGFRSVS